LFREGITVEITAMSSIPSAGNKSFSTLITWSCLFFAHQDVNPLYLVLYQCPCHFLLKL
jgi:hypothetical protein